MTPDERKLIQEAAQRRTFAIISHPDAGKTTLTEKLLLYGGAIHEAGAVKQRKAQRYATSDWMKIEQERGISVTSSVLRFEKDGVRFNLLDTPGHKDFSEDTLRTLTAADCGLMVIDVAKGVEAQTEKLFEVCKLRGIPIVTFVNKCDRPGMEPLEVLSNIETRLGIRAVAASWPVGYGQTFQGMVDLIDQSLHLYIKRRHGAQRADTELFESVDAGLSETSLSDNERSHLAEELEMVGDEYHAMSADEFASGRVTPVFFGSALNNFGLDIFLHYFATLCPPPKPYIDADGSERGLTEPFAGFVFKLQANMNPAHRDCAAFVRVVSGVFRRGMDVIEARTGRSVRMVAPHTLLGDERQILEVAYPGDIIALNNPGFFRIGSTLYESGATRFNIIPLFAPEHFARVSSIDPFRRKQLHEGLQQLSEEGVVHVFEIPDGPGNELMLGVVGQLQFDVVKHRMQNEYACDLRMTPTTCYAARWLPDDDAAIARLRGNYGTSVVQHSDKHPIALFTSAYAMNLAVEALGAENLQKFKSA
ncbi:MAG: peptide chain release factor 3 [Myxococcales bacterium]|nr:peptide chain release factor 3 [Myxococcales bacterium]